jgi:hypothetical protein
MFDDENYIYIYIRIGNIFNQTSVSSLARLLFAKIFLLENKNCMKIMTFLVA